jgi:hypothetical protein
MLFCVAGIYVLTKQRKKLRKIPAETWIKLPKPQNFLLIFEHEYETIITGGGDIMARNSRSKTSFEQMKYEIANEVGVNLKQGYNGNLSTYEAGKIGGNIVKRVFQAYTGNQYPSEPKNQQEQMGK